MQRYVAAAVPAALVLALGLGGCGVCGEDGCNYGDDSYVSAPVDNDTDYDRHHHHGGGYHSGGGHHGGDDDGHHGGHDHGGGH